MSERKKEQVAYQFNRAASSYDDAARIQQYAARKLLDMLPAMDGRWLDLGCGTGFAVRSMLKKGAERVTGIDIAESMVRASLSKLKDVNYGAVTGDAENLPFQENSFEGIYSNLMIQWSENPEQLFADAKKVLSPGSRFAFTTLGPRTMHELKTAWQEVDPYVHVNRFMDREDMLDICRTHFEIEQVQQQEYVQLHPSLTALLKELKAIGATNVNSGRRPGLGGRERLAQLDIAYQKQSTDNQLPLTYDLIWVVARVPSSQDGDH